MAAWRARPARRGDKGKTRGGGRGGWVAEGGEGGGGTLGLAVRVAPRRLGGSGRRLRPLGRRASSLRHAALPPRVLLRRLRRRLRVQDFALRGLEVGQRRLQPRLQVLPATRAHTSISAAAQMPCKPLSDITATCWPILPMQRPVRYPPLKMLTSAVLRWCRCRGARGEHLLPHSCHRLHDIAPRAGSAVLRVQRPHPAATAALPRNLAQHCVLLVLLLRRCLALHRPRLRQRLPWRARAIRPAPRRWVGRRGSRPACASAGTAAAAGVCSSAQGALRPGGGIAGGAAGGPRSAAATGRPACRDVDTCQTPTGGRRGYDGSAGKAWLDGGHNGNHSERLSEATVKAAWRK